MSEGAGEQGKSEQLQFDKADFTVPDAMRVCSRCQKGFSYEYFEAGGNFICPACAREVGGDDEDGQFPRALVFGAAAAALGTIIWFAIIKLTDREFGLIAIGVGLLVGFAVRHGARGRGGWRYQALAMVLTYVSITASYVPLVFKSISEPPQTEGSFGPDAAPGTSASPPPVPAAAPESKEPQASASAADFAVAVFFLFALALASPFLGGFSNIMGLIIIGIALYEAWKLNKRVIVTGPFQIRAGPAPTVS